MSYGKQNHSPADTLDELHHELVGLHRRGQYDKALAVGRRLERLIDERPEPPPEATEALNDLAVVLTKKGEYDEALAIHHRVLALERATGAAQTAMARSLNNLAEVERILLRFKEAESHFEQAQAIWRRSRGHDRELAVSLSRLASLRLGQRRLDEAEELLLEARGVWSTVERDRDPRYASILRDLGKIRYFAGRYLEARTLLSQALEIKSDALGEEHPEVASGMQDLAIVEEQLGAYERSADLYGKALRTLRRVLGEDHRDVAKILSNFAELHLTTGRIDEARRLHLEALEVRRKELGQEHPSFATSLHNLAGVYMAAGEYAKALSYAQEGLEIKRRILGEAHPEVIAGLELVGEIELASGRFKATEAAFRQALAQRRKALGPEHPDLAKSLHPLANLYRLIGSHEEARSLCEEALAVQQRALGEHHPEIALSLHNLANVHTWRGDFEPATAIYRRALGIWQATLGDDHPHTLVTRHNLADVQQMAGDPLGARPLLLQALRLERKVLGRQHPTVYRTLLSLARGCAAEGDHRRARRLYRRILDNWRRTLGRDHPDVSQVLSQLAVSCTESGRDAEALALLDEVNRIDDRLLNEVFAIVSDRQRLRYLEIVRSHLDKYLSIALRGVDDQRVVAAAFELVLRRKGLSAEVLNVQRETVLKERYGDLQPQVDEWISLNAEIARRAWAGPTLESRKEHHRQLAHLRERAEELEATLARRIPEVNLDRQLRGAGLEEVAAALPEGSVLVELVEVDTASSQSGASNAASTPDSSRYAAFLLAAGSPDRPALVDLGPALELDREVTELRAAVLTGGLAAREVRKARPSNQALLSAGKRLFRRFVAPLLPQIEDRTRLVLAPDGELSRLPFEILPTGEGDLMFDRYQISYVATGRDVLRSGAARSVGSATSPLVVADPDFDLAGGDPPLENPEESTRSAAHELDFPPLPGTHLEGLWVARRLGTEPWLGARALEEPLKRRRSPRVLHLATHGFFLADAEPPAPVRELVRSALTQSARGFTPPVETTIPNPLLRAGLALAGANWQSKGFTPPAAAEDGILTAADVAGLDLLDTDLVVLSACETGLGEVHRGEGVFGLRRAFIAAGAKSLVISLWRVSDLATALLMDRFYASLTRGQTPYEALRQAQNELRRMTVPEIRERLSHLEGASSPAVQHPAIRRELAALDRGNQQPPFREPYFWGAFVYQGDPQ